MIPAAWRGPISAEVLTTPLAVLIASMTPLELTLIFSNLVLKAEASDTVDRSLTDLSRVPSAELIAVMDEGISAVARGAAEAAPKRARVIIYLICMLTSLDQFLSDQKTGKIVVCKVIELLRGSAYIYVQRVQRSYTRWKDRL